MEFKDIAIDQAEGWTLAHSITAGDRKLAKNTLLLESHLRLLRQAEVKTVFAFRLSNDDIHEDTAARAVASLACGPHLRIGHATRGRCNIHAETAGLFKVPDSLHQLNAVDEAITLATLPDMSPVAKGQLVATAKIIPYGVAPASLEKMHTQSCLLALAPFQPFSASLIVTGQALPEKTRKLTEGRLANLEGSITDYERSDHTVSALKSQLEEAAKQENDLLLVLGVSAISDRRDIIPAALEAAGGEILSLGMPVDPGNLLMLGTLQGKTVLGLPGCARSPALNGLDWVLERFAARLPLDRAVIARMGIGGLLKETPHRPEPRAPLHRQKSASIHPLILAAGRSTRAGGANKLLSTVNSKPVIRQTLSRVMESGFEQPAVVTGHQHAGVSDALSGLRLDILNNANYREGMASSLKVGIEALPQTAEFALIVLGDMPFVQSSTLKQLAETANRLSEFKIFIPTFSGKRGNPVLWHQDLFPKLANVTGDKGGRALIHRFGDLVCEVPVDDPGVLIDLDTPAAMEQFGVAPNTD